MQSIKVAAKISRVKRSPVWASFEEAGKVARCKLCSREFVRQSGTTNLFQHLRSAHKEQYAAAVGEKPIALPTCSEKPSESAGDVAATVKPKTCAGTKPVSAFFRQPNLRTCDGSRAGMITEKVIDWIVDSTRPFSIVSDPGLVDLLRFTEPQYKLPSGTHFSSLIKKRHTICIGEMKKLLSSHATAGASLTTDGWSLTSSQSFVTHTVHFLDNQWNVVSGVFETGVFQGSHTAEKLAACTTEICDKFGLDDTQVVGVTHDEAANMVAAGRLLEEKHQGWVSCVCMAHRLQTVVRHAMDMKDVSKLLSKSRKLVGHFKHSCLAAKTLTNKQQQLNPLVQPLKVVQDVSTRWNSTYYMLQRLVKLRVPLTAVLCDDQLTPKRQDHEMLLKDNEWMLAEHLIELLEPFEMATTAVSGQRYVTLSLLLPVVSHLYLEVSSTLEKQLPTAAKNVAAKLKSKVTRKFPEISTPSPSSLSVVAAALDPRFRHLNFLDSDKAEAVKEEVLDRAEEQFGTKATTNLLEPPAKRAAPTGSLSRLFKSRATEPGEPAGKYPTRLDREVEVYFEEAEVDTEEDPLAWWMASSVSPCGRTSSASTQRARNICSIRACVLRSWPSRHEAQECSVASAH